MSPYLGLVRLPHPDPPPIAAGKAAVIEAENARIPQAGPRRRLPPAGGVSVFIPLLKTSFHPGVRVRDRSGRGADL